MTHPQYQSCIEACDSCADACDYCSTECLKEDHIKMMVECIRLDMDCAAICRAASGCMARDGRYAKDLCRLCAQVCEACAKECARHPQAHCQACAQACRRCAEECRRMVSA